jgi:hypothetical protein
LATLAEARWVRADQQKPSVRSWAVAVPLAAEKAVGLAMAPHALSLAELEAPADF